MKIRSPRTVVAGALIAFSVAVAGCTPAESVSSATPAPPSPVTSAPPATASATTPPVEVTPTPEPDPVSFDPVPAAKPQPLSEIIVATATPSARDSAAAASTSTAAANETRRNPPPPGSVDCSSAKCIALTFDDGPGPHTARLVGMLTSKGARATFFMQGVMIRANPSLARQVANTPGMEIANHSSTHPQLTRVSSTRLYTEIAGTHALIKEVTGKDVTVFRPPYGARNAAVDAMAAQVGEAVILWDVDTNDWRTRSASATRQTVAQQARSGSIVLMHDIHGSTVDAVPGIIDDLQGQGYVLVTVSELLGGTTPGKVYSRR